MKREWSAILGGILLVVGTTVGAGMLGLPISSGFTGFFPSLLLFVISWFFMLSSAFFFIDVHSTMEGDTNLITMAERTLGFSGRALSWIVYLLLLYSLLAAYMGASAPLFVWIAKSLQINLPLSFSKFLLPLLFGPFIYLGTRGVDLLNRALMVGLIASYILLACLLPEHVQRELIMRTSWKPFIYAAPVVMTSFGYHIIIPTLATYLNRSRKALFLTVTIGSVLALLINLLWLFLTLGTIPLEGEGGLAQAWLQGIPVTGSLSKIIASPLLPLGATLFAFFAILTSFLGVSLSLGDFLIDGLKIKKSWKGRILAILLSFIPPLLFIFSYQRGFLLALEYAGAFVAILLVFLPAAMAWTLTEKPLYQKPIGRLWLLATIAFSFSIIVVNILNRWGFFDTLLLKMGG
ncbi:MAG: tyrosine transporter [Verrucomicrobia bacterium]|nr:tyrosine transporter [Verrucomicrobiota bacterium]